MELTKQQIQYIDYRLENEGIKYWDIRIEMLDHVISDVEIKLKPENTEYEFKELVQESLVSLGWKENFNGGGLDQIFIKILTDYSKKSKLSIWSFYKKMLIKTKSIFLLFMFWFYLFSIYHNKQFVKYTMVLIFLLLVSKIVKTMHFSAFRFSF